MDIFLNESTILGISFPAKIIQYTESSGYSLLQSSKWKLFIKFCPSFVLSSCLPW